MIAVIGHDHSPSGPWQPIVCSKEKAFFKWAIRQECDLLEVVDFETFEKAKEYGEKYLTPEDIGYDIYDLGRDALLFRKYETSLAHLNEKALEAK